MYHFTAGHTLYKRIGLALFLAQYSIYIFGFPPFQGGIWAQTEPAIIAFFLFAVCNALWLLAGVGKRWLAKQGWHPIAFCLLLWVGWQLLVTLLSPSPWRSWFGPPETGQGAGWHVALLLMVMVAYPLWQVREYRRILLVGAALNIMTQALLHWFNPVDPVTLLYAPGSWAPAQWAAYLAFMVAYVWIALMVTGAIRSVAAHAAVVVCALPVLYISQNKSAMPLLILAMIVSLLLATFRAPAIRRFFYPLRRWRILLLAACVLPVGGIVFSMYYGTLPHQEALREYPALLAEKDGSIGSRLVLNQASMSVMQHEPWRWLLGKGWGRYADDAYRYALVDGVYAYHEGKRQTNWSVVEGHVYHSHSQPLETLLALGLPGLLFWFALPMLALWGMPKRYFWDAAPMLVGLVTLSYLWFEIVQCVAYQALCLAALCSVCAGKRISAGSRGWQLVVLGCVSAVMAWSAWQQREAMRYGSDILVATHTQPYQDYTVAWLGDDAKRGGDRFRISSLGYALTMADKIRYIPSDDIDRGWYGRFMDTARQVASLPHIGPHVAAVEVWLYYKLLIDVADPSFAELGHHAAVALPDAVLRLCMKAPERDDLAAPMLVNLGDMMQHDTQRQITLLRHMLAIAPHHRGAMWVLGQLLLAAPGHEEEGDALLRKAVALGVERVYPLTSEEIEPFRQAASR